MLLYSHTLYVRQGSGHTDPFDALFVGVELLPIITVIFLCDADPKSFAFVLARPGRTDFSELVEFVPFRHFLPHFSLFNLKLGQ